MPATEGISQQQELHGDHTDDPLLLSLLAMARLHGLPASENTPVAGLPLVDGKLTPALFPRAAKRIGLSARVVKKDLSHISQLLMPIILLLENNHACILLEKLAGNKVRVLYPETGDGEAVVEIKSLQDSYCGYAIMASPEHGFDRRVAVDSLSSDGHWFWGTIKQSWRIYRDVLLASFLVNLFAIVNPLFVMNVYDRVVPNDAKETLWVLAIGVGVVIIFDFLLRLLRGGFIDLAGKKADVILSSRLFERILGMKLSSRPSSVGVFANNFREFDSIRDFITSASVTTLIDLPFVVIFLLVIYFLAGPVVIVPLVAIPLIIAYGFFIQRPLQQAAENASRAASQKSALLIESLTVAESVKYQSAESSMQSRWENAVGSLAKWDAKSRELSSSASSVAMLAQQLVAVAVVVFGVYLVEAGELSLGGLIAAVILAGRSVAPMSQVAQLTTRYHQSRNALQALDDMMQMPVERPEGKHFLSRPVLQGDIQFDAVTFSYPNDEVAVLRDVSFSIKAGEKVAIIGRIGSGKSTLEKLLLGLYEAEAGAVRVDGVDIRQLDPADLRKNIGYVPQDIDLFFGSVRENIVMGASHVNDQAVLEAASLTGVADFVNYHPMGFDMPVGERGDQLSGGQRQAVTMARALLQKPPVLILDEPTSSMDNSSEENIKRNLEKILPGKTMILVTHRASLLELVDRILVMDAGRLVADGPKEQVLAALKQGRIKTGGVR